MNLWCYLNYLLIPRTNTRTYVNKWNFILTNNKLFLLLFFVWRKIKLHKSKLKILYFFGKNHWILFNWSYKQKIFLFYLSKTFIFDSNHKKKRVFFLNTKINTPFHFYLILFLFILLFQILYIYSYIQTHKKNLSSCE